MVDVPPYSQYTPEELEHLRRSLAAGPARVLLRGAVIVTMDDELGDLPSGDVLIAGSTIEAIASDLAPLDTDGDIVVVNARGLIVAPGLVDAHRHCWQGQLRRLLPDADLAGYWNALIGGGIAERYEPVDSHIGTLLTLLGALDAGVTSIVDFSHNSATAEHADAVFAAYEHAGMRVVHVACPPETDRWEVRWPEELVRLRDTYATGLASVRLGINKRRRVPLPELFDLARDYGFSVTMDAVSGPRGSEQTAALGGAGLLGDDVTLTHCNDLTDDAWAAITDAGCEVTLAPLSDAYIGVADALPPIQRCRDIGVLPSVGVDVETSLPSDLFSELRCVLTLQRMAITAARYRGETTTDELMTSREALACATVHGAAASGLGDQVGRLAPGRQADLMLLSATDINLTPLNDPVGSIVLGADPRNVAAVFVGGVVRKWNGGIVGHDLAELREAAVASRDRVVGEFSDR